MNDNNYYIYILSNKKHGTLYVGSTNDLQKRIYEHKNRLIKNSFTYKYKLHNLVYFEGPTNMESARHREWLIKIWKRQWKYNIIEKNNPDWQDLAFELDPATSAGTIKTNTGTTVANAEISNFK